MLKPAGHASVAVPHRNLPPALNVPHADACYLGLLK
jgi:hypothetical protein